MLVLTFDIFSKGSVLCFMGKDYFRGFKYPLFILAGFTPLVREPVVELCVAAYVCTNNAFIRKMTLECICRLTWPILICT